MDAIKNDMKSDVKSDVKAKVGPDGKPIGGAKPAVSDYRPSGYAYSVAIDAKGQPIPATEKVTLTMVNKAAPPPVR